MNQSILSSSIEGRNPIYLLPFQESTNLEVLIPQEIYYGPDDDILNVTLSNQAAFGTNGEDIFLAINSRGNNRLIGANGDDTFFMGNNDTALGGPGNDVFYGASGSFATITFNQIEVLEGEGLTTGFLRLRENDFTTRNRRLTVEAENSDRIGINRFQNDLLNALLPGSNRSLIVVTDRNNSPRVRANQLFVSAVGVDADELTGTTGVNNSLVGGSGNDTFYLGSGNRAFGGAGNDTFFVETGGGNRINGGAGRDTIWLTNGELPESSNRVIGFNPREDRLGIIGYNYNDLEFGRNTIGIDGETIATLSGVNASNLSRSNFIFG